MPPKQKKIVLWTKCSNCSAEISSNDSKLHSENCNISNALWTTSYILDKIFYSNLEFNSSETDVKEGYVLLHHSVIQMCDFVIGEPVKIKCTDSTYKPIVRRAWPSFNANHLTSVILNQEDANIWPFQNQLKVNLSKLNDSCILSKVVYVSTDYEIFDKTRFIAFIKYFQRNKFFSPLDVITINYFGKTIKLNIVKINDEIKQILDDKWFACTDDTTWILQDCQNVSKNIQCPNIIGVDNILKDIFSIMDVVFRKTMNNNNAKLMKSILLYGASGTGKSTIAKHVALKSNTNVVNISPSQVYSKFYGETELSLKKLFDEAIKNNPSIIVIDDIDILCPKRTTTGTEQEKRISNTLASLLDHIHEPNIRVVLLCCTSKVDNVEPMLRRFGRIDREIEVPIPDQFKRFEILSNFLSNVIHSLTLEETKLISDASHGFVGADIANLCTQASMHMLSTSDSRGTLTLNDFQNALHQVTPSAMREVLIDLPDVKWCDIGGQDDLKLKLKQLVEWPLKYCESFTRLGIKAPSGILMYGPPGCSKTMIAKAVASESRLNFLSIKGPELFSKWVGESERAVRELFRKARQVAPSIIFFDEIDALSTERSKQGNTSNVQERVLAQLLTEMDGITPLGNVTIIAATNRPDKIDSALLRPGRLDRIVYVPLPDDSTRTSIFKIKLSKMPVSPFVNISELVNRSKGYSGAEITAICHEAAMSALEEDIQTSQVSLQHFNKAFDIVKPRTPESLLLLYEEFSNCA